MHFTACWTGSGAAARSGWEQQSGTVGKRSESQCRAGPTTEKDIERAIMTFVIAAAS